MPAANRLPHSFEGVDVSLLRQLQRVAPVAQERSVRLVGDQQVDVLGLHADSVAHRVRHLGHLTVAAGQHLGDLAFGETDASPRRDRPATTCAADPWRSSCRRRTRRRCGIRRRGSATCPTRATRPTAAPSPGTEACALRRMVSWSKIVPAAFCATAISAVSSLTRLDQGAGHLHAQDEGRTAAVVQVDHPIRFHAKAMRHPAAAAVERHVGQLRVGDQDVDVRDGVLAVAFDQTRGGPFHHVDGRFVLGARGGGTSAPGTSGCRAGRRIRRTGVVVGGDRLTGQVGRDVEQADGHRVSRLTSSSPESPAGRCGADIRQSP